METEAARSPSLELLAALEERRLEPQVWCSVDGLSLGQGLVGPEVAMELPVSTVGTVASMVVGAVVVVATPVKTLALAATGLTALWW